MEELASSCSETAAAQMVKAAIHDETYIVDKYDKRLLHLIDLASQSSSTLQHQASCHKATADFNHPVSPSPYCQILSRSKLQSVDSPASLLNVRKFSIPSTPGTPASFSNLLPGNLVPRASPAYSIGAASRFASSPITDQGSQPPPSPASLASLAASAGAEHSNASDVLYASELWAAIVTFDCQLDADIEDASKASAMKCFPTEFGIDMP
eukprot:gene6843-7061_t